MRRMFVPAIGILLALGAPAAAVAQTDDGAKLAEAHAIIAIMFPPAERDHMFDKVLSDLSAQYRQSIPSTMLSDPGLKGIIDDFLNRALQRERPMLQKRGPALLEAMAEAYTHEFSLTELQAIHAFAQTPAGSHYLTRSSALIGDPAVAKVNTALMSDARELSVQMSGELKEKVVAYLKAHPEVVKKMEANAGAKGK